MLRRLATIPAIITLLACCAATANAASGWTIQPTPNPADGHFNVLTSVACSSTSDCTATGSIGGQIGLSELWNGSRWRLESVAPGGLSAPELLDVSCPVAASCMATTRLNMTEHWNGHAWSLEHLASPAPAFTSLQVPAVSCATATDCTGFGAYTANGTCFGVAEHWNGSSWAVQSHVPGGCGRSPCRNVQNNCGLVSISCPSAESCMAVGGGVSEFWNGTAWASEPIASPGGILKPALAGVSCTAAGSCMAVGLAGDNAITKILAEQWNGTAWTILPTPKPAGQHSAALAGVSCPSAANCTAVGSSTSSTGSSKTLAEHWNGTAWAIQPTPNRSGSSENFLDGVSCPVAAHCTATGSFFGGPGSDTLAEAR